MAYRGRKSQRALLGGVAFLALVGTGGMAVAQENAQFNIAPQPLASALNEFAVQSPWPILYTTQMTGDKRTAGVSGATNPELALNTLLEGTGLGYRREGETFLIVKADTGPQAGSAAGGGAEVEALIVTAQKREEDIQDVPIAISAFTQKALDEQKIEGGFDLLKAIPNVTFSKNNFSSYNFSIRGIGTKAISVTTDPGVAVAFNGSSLIRNRLFEQEYFDVERVEVLRGPQGTLYGRNATAGVINVISAKPKMNDFEGWLKGEVGNYHSKRLSAMVNVPLLEDKLAVRLAGALTNRDGYDYNATTKNAINGRDLWSARLTVGFEPTENLRGNLIWERFEEDDNRSRTGKQLCHRDPGPTAIGDYELSFATTRAMFGQGCKAGSLYDPMALGTPNGLSIPYLQIGTFVGFSTVGNACQNFAFCPLVPPVKLNADPYGGMMQSSDLRVINSIKDPVYRATTDVLELNVDYDVGNHLTITSQTAYVEDQIYSTQDYNRFNTAPIFNDSAVLPWYFDTPNEATELTKGGVYCDPQIGCSDSVAGFDVSQAKSLQFTQELRLVSDFDGPLNFSVGANYLRYRTIEDYYVMINLLSLITRTGGGGALFNGDPDVTKCKMKDDIGFGYYSAPSVVIGEPGSEGCVYIDPNPLESINGEGHNYFRSKNPYTLNSSAVFGELYWKVAPDVKITAGLRYTDDRKTFTPVPSQLLLSSSAFLGGTVDRGYPELPDIEQHWGEVTGRLGFDWTPELTFTDRTMIYGSYAHGYKGGGSNPPGIGFRTEPKILPGGGEFPPIVQTLSYPATFEPEYIDAFEIGAKNTLFSGAMILNVGAFFYDYKDYQVSQIKERTAVNENFDAKVWGLELESVFRPTENLRLNAALGYQDTEIADGEQSIDLMNRTQGDPDLVLVKAWVQLPSNCVVYRSALEAFLNQRAPGGDEQSLYTSLWEVCGGQAFIPEALDGPNDGAGVYDQLGGNELPNAPHWTVSLGGQYEAEIASGWRATVRADAYWQSQSWARVYNAVNDKLHGWYNANLSVWIENDEGLKIELYAKNILDGQPITDAFLNSDDSGLTTNVFALDPRLIGLSIRKEF